MNQEDIIKMARWAGLLPIDIGPTIETWQIRRKEESLVRFAALVAAAEREACAKVCEQAADDEFYMGRQYADAIRARDEQ